MSKQPLNDTEKLNNLLATYLETKNKLAANQYGEIEVKFGTRGIKRITKNNFDNVIQQLLSQNFTLKEESLYYLNIKTDTIRTSIDGLKNIQEYCRKNSIPDNYPREAYSFKEKVSHEGSRSFVNFDDFNFRISYAIETNVSHDSEIVADLLRKWPGQKKFYRLINRYTMVHEDYPVVVDLSIVRESTKEQNNLKESAIFNLPEKYEIEIEVINDKLTDTITPQILDVLLKKITKFVLSGLQGTNFPISYSEQNQTLSKYMTLIHGDKYREILNRDDIKSKDFIGPSSTTLQIANLVPPNKNSNMVNIRSNYTVTDKADGERKMMYISDKGKIYFITTLMEIEFTGAQTRNSVLFNSLLDGEHIKHNKKGEFINLYAAFDIYYHNNKDIRKLLFVPQTAEDIKTNFRLPLLTSVIRELNAVLVNTTKLPPINIQKKTFYETSELQTIFVACNTLQSKIDAGQFVYETDGFIFTPSNLGVGENPDAPQDRPRNSKVTWDYSLKWKPPAYNTVDFLVTTKKLQSGIEYVGNVFEAGLNVQALEQIVQYKTIVLRVGYNQRFHGYINPCEDIFRDTDMKPSSENRDDESSYKPVQFIPSNPYDPEAGITNIELKLDTTNNKQMFTEAGEIIEDNTIVEFRYDMDKPSHWRWIPLRVRYDKTAELKRTKIISANAYHVAENNWYSIYNPVTIEMLTTGKEIPNEIVDDDVYYNAKKGFSHTKALRDFHNLFVKNKLITSVSKPGNTLIDYAVGKGGDIPKWIQSHLSFVFGIDISRDNIQNKKDGACARYLNAKKRDKVVPDALFLRGNAAENIKDTSAFYTEKAKIITKAVFGDGPKDEKFLDKGVLKSYGRGADGFNISSIQFAIHYMFENVSVLNNFLTNIAECTKLGGYFVGTSYDGKEVFKLLKKLEMGDSELIMDREDKHKLLEITKQYSSDTFPDDINCLGYQIDVFQESINKTFKEYLVNYDYLISQMENYGFVQLTSTEAKEFGLNSSIGSFSDLFALMTSEIKRARDPEKFRQNFGMAYKMTKQQKDISFLNKYFIFKKVRHVNISDAKMGLIKTSDQERIKLVEETLMAQHEVSEINKEEKQTAEKQTAEKQTAVLKKPRILKKSLKLVDSKQSKQ